MNFGRINQGVLTGAISVTPGCVFYPCSFVSMGDWAGRLGNMTTKVGVIQLENVLVYGSYKFSLTGTVPQRVGYINATYECGKAYGLIGELVFGAPAISWTIAGNMVPSEGEILVNGNVANRHLLQQISHSVWLGPKDPWLFRKDVKTLIAVGLRESRIEFSLGEIVEVFGLERLDRPLKFCGNERWRASIAIGFSQGKSVFCFPWLWYDFVRQYKKLWMKRVFGFLKENNRLVVVPTGNDEISEICDEVAIFL
jgi:hypothetical protein